VVPFTCTASPANATPVQLMVSPLINSPAGLSLIFLQLSRHFRKGISRKTPAEMRIPVVPQYKPW
ncbi:MAG: hypothetical protein M0017_02210, partial [Desulfobacteraceae bacterium]|nr:hypothetical protein [Desulfobacteraceae bacterium]